MGTPPQLVQMAFASGLDESQQDEVLDPTAGFPVVQNARQDRRGGFFKRLGFAPLASTMLDGTSRSTGNRVFVNRDTPCVIDGTHLHSYSGATGAWTNHGRVPEATYRHLEVPSVGSEHPVSDVVYCGGLIVVSHEFLDDGDYFAIVSVLDATTGAVVRPPEAIDNSLSGTGIRICLATYGAHVVAVVGDTSATDLRAWYLDTTSRATVNTGWVSIGTIANNWSVSGVALDVVGLSNRVAVAYRHNGGGTSRLTVKTFDSGGVIETVDINTSSIDPDGVSLSEGGTTLWVAWAEETIVTTTHTTNFRVIGLDPADIDGTPLATVATVIQTVRTGLGGGMTWVVATGSGTGTLYAINEHVFAPDGTNYRAFTTSGGATTPSGSTQKLCNSTPVGRPFVRSGRVYIPMSSNNLEELVVCDCTVPLDNLNWRPVIVPVQRGLYNLLTSRALARTAATDATHYVHAFNVLKAGTIFNGINGTALVEYDFADPVRWKPAAVNRSTFLSGGVETVFDGRRLCEAAFLCRPPAPGVDVAGAGSQTFAAGRTYVVTYEDIDADGNWHVSGVSSPVSTGAISSKEVVLTVVPLSITSRTDDLLPFGAGVRISIWGTVDGNEPPYYRLTSIANYSYIESTTWEDDLDEDDFTSNALLYATGNLPGTGGSSQDHRATPGLKHHVSYNGMLVGLSGPDVFHSSQPIDGEGTWFSPVFSQSIEDEGTGIATQDGTVYLFTRRGVFAVAGEPPSDNGTAGGLGAPRKLAVDVGCIDANSIVVTSLGIFFQSERGIELLGRGGGVMWVGEKVQATLAAYPVISSAVLDDRNGLVRFSLAAAESGGRVSGDGRDLIFDLALGTWVSVDDKTGTSSHEASQDAALTYVGGLWRYSWLGADGTLYYERLSSDGSAHLDGSTWVTMVVETGSYKSGGIQGKQQLNRLLILARKSSDLNLSVSLAYNYESSYRTARVWTRAEINTLLSNGWPITQLKHEPHDDAECQAVRVRIEDATPTGGTVGTGKGATWIALTLDVTQKQGAFEVPEEAA